MIYIPYAKVNCLKTIPFTAAHTYIAHIWQYRPRPPGVLGSAHKKFGVMSRFDNVLFVSTLQMVKDSDERMVKTEKKSKQDKQGFEHIPY